MAEFPPGFQLCLIRTAQLCDWFAEGGIFAFVHSCNTLSTLQQNDARSKKGQHLLKLMLNYKKSPLSKDVGILDISFKQTACTLNNVQSPAEASVTQLCFILFLTHPHTCFTNLNIL